MSLFYPLYADLPLLGFGSAVPYLSEGAMENSLFGPTLFGGEPSYPSYSWNKFNFSDGFIGSSPMVGQYGLFGDGGSFLPWDDDYLGIGWGGVEESWATYFLEDMKGRDPLMDWFSRPVGGQEPMTYSDASGSAYHDSMEHPTAGQSLDPREIRKGEILHDIHPAPAATPAPAVLSHGDDVPLPAPAPSPAPPARMAPETLEFINQFVREYAGNGTDPAKPKVDVERAEHFFNLKIGYSDSLDKETITPDVVSGFLNEAKRKFGGHADIALIVGGYTFFFDSPDSMAVLTPEKFVEHIKAPAPVSLPLKAPTSRKILAARQPVPVKAADVLPAPASPRAPEAQPPAPARVEVPPAPTAPTTASMTLATLLNSLKKKGIVSKGRERKNYEGKTYLVVKLESEDSVDLKTLDKKKRADIVQTIQVFLKGNKYSIIEIGDINFGFDEKLRRHGVLSVDSLTEQKLARLMKAPASAEARPAEQKPTTAVSPPVPVGAEAELKTGSGDKLPSRITYKEFDESRKRSRKRTVTFNKVGSFEEGIGIRKKGRVVVQKSKKDGILEIADKLRKVGTIEWPLMFVRLKDGTEGYYRIERRQGDTNKAFYDEQLANAISISIGHNNIEEVVFIHQHPIQPPQKIAENEIKYVEYAPPSSTDLEAVATLVKMFKDAPFPVSVGVIDGLGYYEFRVRPGTTALDIEYGKAFYSLGNRPDPETVCYPGWIVEHSFKYHNEASKPTLKEAIGLIIMCVDGDCEDARIRIKLGNFLAVHKDDPAISDTSFFKMLQAQASRYGVVASR